MFTKLNLFDGEVFIDENRMSYTALDFKTMSLLEVIPALASSAARAARSTAKALGLSGNMDGDKLQNGGCLVVEKGEESNHLLYFIQKTPHHRVSSVEVLKALGIDGEVPTTEALVEPVVNEPLYKKYHETYLLHDQK